MAIQTLTTFFMWCTIINGALLALWITMCIVAPDVVYRTQKIWFPISREISMWSCTRSSGSSELSF